MKFLLITLLSLFSFAAMGQTSANIQPVKVSPADSVMNLIKTKLSINASIVDSAYNDIQKALDKQEGSMTVKEYKLILQAVQAYQQQLIGRWLQENAKQEALKQKTK